MQYYITSYPHHHHHILVIYIMDVFYIHITQTWSSSSTSNQSKQVNQANVNCLCFFLPTSIIHIAKFSHYSKHHHHHSCHYIIVLYLNILCSFPLFSFTTCAAFLYLKSKLKGPLNPHQSCTIQIYINRDNFRGHIFSVCQNIIYGCSQSSCYLKIFDNSHNYLYKNYTKLLLFTVYSYCLILFKLFYILYKLIVTVRCKFNNYGRIFLNDAPSVYKLIHWFLSQIITFFYC